MNCRLFPVVLILLAMCIPGTENSFIQFKGNPSVIHPMLATTLQLQCSLVSLSSNPFIKYIYDYTTTTHHYGAMATTPRTTTTVPSTTRTTMPTTRWTKPTTSTTFPSTTTLSTPTRSITPTPPANTPPATTPLVTATQAPTPSALNLISADVAHVTSINIIKLLDNGQRVDVASVSLFDAASSDGYYASLARVEGSCERSPVDGEKGYLSVTWSKPIEEQSGQYICEISGLGVDRHPVTLQSSLQVTFSQPTLTDLISYISDNAAKISNLETKVINLNNSYSNTTSPANLKAQNIQKGSGECMYITEYSISFPKNYKSAPTVFLSITNFTSRGYNSYDRAEGSVSIYSVSYWGFYVRCHINEASLAFEWLAIDN